MSIEPTWPTVLLGSLASARKGAMAGGPFGSDLVSNDYVESGVPVVRGTNLPLTSRFSCDNFVFVSPTKADRLHLNCAKPGDLVFTQRGTLGQVGVLPANTPFQRFLISQSQMKMTVDEAKACPTFLYYYFRLRGTVSYIESIALQAGVPHINLGILRKFPVTAPPLKNQQSIGAVLTAYDDLIENNRRRISLLERMAEQLYREWFVRFRFPGYRQAKFEKGVPATWRILRLGDLYKTSSGGTPSRTTPSNYGGNIKWLKTGELKSLFVLNTIETISELGLESSSAKVFPRMTVVMAMYCAMPDVSILGVDSATNQACCALLPKHDYLQSSFTYFLARNALAQMVTFAHGAAQQNLSQDIVKNFKVLVPDSCCIEAYVGIGRSFFDQIEALLKANIHLQECRDLLLPRLISGKLRVDDLDIRFPPSMQAST